MEQLIWKDFTEFIIPGKILKSKKFKEAIELLLKLYKLNAIINRNITFEEMVENSGYKDIIYCILKDPLGCGFPFYYLSFLFDKPKEYIQPNNNHPYLSKNKEYLRWYWIPQFCHIINPILLSICIPKCEKMKGNFLCNIGLYEDWHYILIGYRDKKSNRRVVYDICWPLLNKMLNNNLKVWNYYKLFDKSIEVKNLCYTNEELNELNKKGFVTEKIKLIY